MKRKGSEKQQKCQCDFCVKVDLNTQTNHWLKSYLDPSFLYHNLKTLLKSVFYTLLSVLANQMKHSHTWLMFYYIHKVKLKNSNTNIYNPLQIKPFYMESYRDNKSREKQNKNTMWLKSNESKYQEEQNSNFLPLS